MDLIMKPHDKDSDMVEILLTGGTHLVAVIHIDSLYEPGGHIGTLHDLLRRGHEVPVSLEINK